MAVTQPLASQGQALSLSQHPELILLSTQAWGVMGVNTCAHAPDAAPLPLQIGNRTYSDGLGHHATGEIIISLEGRFDRFEAEVGVQRQDDTAGSVVFQVFVDGKKRFDSGIVRQSDGAKSAGVNVKGAWELRLVSGDAGDGMTCDCANWANARLIPGKQSSTRLTPVVDAAPFARVVTYDPARMDGSRANRVEEFRAEDLFLDTDVLPGEDGHYTAPVWPGGHACIGLQWLERRYLSSLALHFDGQAPSSADAQVQGWEGESAWQGRWVPLKGTIAATGRSWKFDLDLAANSAARAGLRKVRWVLPATIPVRVSGFSAPMRARTDVAELTLQLENAPAGATGTIEIYNGEILSPKGEGIRRAWNLSKPLKLKVRHILPGVWKSDRTVLRFKLPSGSFGVALDDVVSSKCVYVRDGGLFVALDSAKLSLEDYKRKIARRKTVLERVRTMPDQTFEQAIRQVHHDVQNNGQMMLSLACDNHKFIVHRDGMIQIETDPTAGEKAVSTLTGYAAQILPRFGSGSNTKVSRALEGGWLPVHVTTVEDGDIHYTQRTFAAPFGERPGARIRWLESRGLGVAEFSAVNTGGRPASVHLELSLFTAADKGEKAAIRKRGDDFDALAGDRLLLSISTAKCAPLTPAAKDGTVILSGTLQPGEKATLTACIPAWLAAPGDQLEFPDSEALLAATGEYWKRVIADSARMDLPDPFLMDVIRASQVHCLMAARNEDGGRTIAPWIASVAYGPLESEANSIVRGMGLLGYSEFTRRSLDYFIGRYSPSGILTTGYTLMGLGWHLQTLGEHYMLERNDAWLKEAAPKVALACDWIVRQRDKTKVEGPGGERRIEYGLVPPGVEADWNAFAYHFCLNGYYYAGLHNAALALAETGYPDAGAWLKAAARFRQDILRAYHLSQSWAPVLPLQDGTWAPAYPSQLHSPGRTGDFFPGEDGNRSWCYDVELGAHHLTAQGVLDPHSRETADIMDHMEDVQFLSEGWFDYPAEQSRRDWFNLGGFSKVQPYYTRNAEICALRDDVKPFIRSYFNTICSLLNMETLWLWEHFRNVAAWNKTHETGYFLQQTRFMLAMEHGEELWLAPLVTNNWMNDGMTVSASGLPTRFGPVSYRIVSHAAAGAIEAEIEPPRRNPAKSIVIRLRHPDGKRMKKALVNGEPTLDFDAEKEIVRIPAASGKVTVRAVY